MKLRNNYPVKLIFILMLVLTIFSATATEYDVVVNDIDGKVDYVDLINSSANLTDLENAVTINNAYISVDTETYPELDTLATLTFYNITLDNPIFTKNGWWMDNEYTVIEGEEEYADNYEVEVEGFSIWEMIESNFSLGTHNQTSIFNSALSLEPDVYVSIGYDRMLANDIVYDNSAYSNAYSSTKPINGTDCKYDGCLEFDGLTDKLKTNEQKNISLNDTFTISAWVRNNEATIVRDEIFDYSTTLKMYVDNNKLVLWADTDGEGWHLSAFSNPYNFNETVNVAVVYNGTEVSLYINGVDETDTQYTTDGDLNLVNNYLEIGNSLNSPTHAWDGNIECVQMWDTPLDLSQITDVNSSASCDDTLHSPIHSWALDEYTKTQEDSVNDLDFDMGSFWTNESMFGNYAYEFDGYDDTLRITDSATFGDEKQFTVSSWFYPRDDVNSQIPITKGKYNQGGWYFWLQGSNFDKCVITLSDGVSTVSASSPNNCYEADEWIHLLFTVNNDTVVLYKNGEEELNITIAIDWTQYSNDIQLGYYYTNHDYDGFMDETKFYERVLTNDEIQDLYNSNPLHRFVTDGDYTTITHNASDYDSEIEEQIWHNLTLNYLYDEDTPFCGGYCNQDEVEQYIYAQSSEDNITWTGWVLGTLEISNESTAIYTFPDGSLQGRYIKGFIGWESNNSIEDDLIESYSFTGFKALKPSASDLNIYPNNITTSDNIYGNATFNLNDTDTDLSMDFVWYADDVQIYTETINGLQNGSVAVSTLPSSYTNKEKVVYFIVTPIGSLDVEGDSVQSDNVTVQNANFSIDDYNPSSQNITLTIPNAYTFNLDITDPDNDVVCNWTLNGEGIFTGNPFVFSSGSYFSGINELEVECTDGEFTDTVTWNLTLEETDLTLPMIIGLAFVTFILLFFAFNLDKEHFIFKMLLIFLSLITLILIPTTLISGVNSVKDNFLNIGLWLFRLFVVYFSIYLFYHWTKKTEVLKKWFK